MKGNLSTESNAKLIPLTQGRVAIVDAADYQQLNEHKWYALKDSGRFYARRTENGRAIEMHRQILNAPEGLLCDHKNHNGLDNRRANLRLCTPSQNSQNQLPRAGGSSIYKGVSRENNRWRADIQLNGRHIFIGYFDDQLDAAIAYDDMAIELFGEFACLNLDFHPEIKSWLQDSYLFDPTHYETLCLCR